MATHLSGPPHRYKRETETATGKLKLPHTHTSSQYHSSLKLVSYRVFLYGRINGAILLVAFWWEFYVFAIRGLMKRKISIFIDELRLFYEWITNTIRMCCPGTVTVTPWPEFFRRLGSLMG
jgi:hypothetical protein